MKESNKKIRKSNIELLRIVAMFLIVLSHFAVHGDIVFDDNSLNINNFLYSFLYMGGKIGVNVFVLISGYFLVNNREIKLDLKHILKFVFQIFFYSFSIFLIFNIINGGEINLKEIVKTLFPIIFNKWWFASTYFVLYLLHPFINKMITSLSEKEYKMLIFILVGCFCLIPTLLNVSFQSNNLLWFITLYSIAGYIKIYGVNNKYSCKQCFILFFVLVLVSYLISVIFIMTQASLDGSMIYIKRIYSQNGFYILLISVYLFIGFNNLTIKYNKFINLVASATFGVYLIHENPLVRPFLWKNIFKSVDYQNSIMLIPYSLIVCLLVYIMCTIIELLRQKVIEKPILHYFEKNDKKNKC